MDDDYEINQEYYANIRRVNKANKNLYDCPTCGAKKALTAYEKQQGYHCESCTREAEGPMLNNYE